LVSGLLGPVILLSAEKPATTNTESTDR